jgi:hypothetical protein
MFRAMRSIRNTSSRHAAICPSPPVPHYRSPCHPETTALGLVAEKYRAGEVPHLTLQDGQALLISGASATIV